MTDDPCDDDGGQKKEICLRLTVLERHFGIAVVKLRSSTAEINDPRVPAKISQEPPRRVAGMSSDTQYNNNNSQHTWL